MFCGSALGREQTAPNLRLVTAASLLLYHKAQKKSTVFPCVRQVGSNDSPARPDDAFIAEDLIVLVALSARNTCRLKGVVHGVADGLRPFSITIWGVLVSPIPSECPGIAPALPTGGCGGDNHEVRGSAAIHPMMGRLMDPCPPPQPKRTPPDPWQILHRTRRFSERPALGIVDEHGVVVPEHPLIRPLTPPACFSTPAIREISIPIVSPRSMDPRAL